MHAKHGFTRTTIEHHADGSSTIVHERHDGEKKTHAVADLDGVHDSLEDHLRVPGDEEEAMEEKIHPGIHEEIKEGLKHG
ncbi:MAG TPA: hypothetical protein VFA52_03970 [Candidatus Paceibacterota bacterium]|jgi:hypothetical protein|nr:hypothetical protein [Candidatus Paceibacterota bacterium]